MDDSPVYRFYAAFREADADKMIDEYHNDIEFCDPAFGTLKGKEAGMMWQMLCHQAKDLVIDFSDIKIKGDRGSARWEAKYTFSQTSRKVHNIIRADFEFLDGKIVKHTDDFDLHKWASQALGLKGKLLGWTVFFQKGLQKQTRKALEKYQLKTSR